MADQRQVSKAVDFPFDAASTLTLVTLCRYAVVSFSPRDS